MLVRVYGDWAEADAKGAGGDEGDFVVGLYLRNIVVDVQSEGLAWGWHDVGVRLEGEVGDSGSIGEVACVCRVVEAGGREPA